MTGAMLIFIDESEEEQMAASDAAAVFVGNFTERIQAPPAWPSKEEIAELWHGNDMIQHQWLGYFERAEKLVEWIKAFQEKVGEQEFADFVPVLHQIASYKGGTN
jgi:hypothetical protein